jgi:hypothetical protein
VPLPSQTAPPPSPVHAVPAESLATQQPAVQVPVRQASAEAQSPSPWHAMLPSHETGGMPPWPPVLLVVVVVLPPVPPVPAGVLLHPPEAMATEPAATSSAVTTGICCS